MYLPSFKCCSVHLFVWFVTITTKRFKPELNIKSRCSKTFDWSAEMLNCDLDNVRYVCVRFLKKHSPPCPLCHLVWVFGLCPWWGTSSMSDSKWGERQGSELPSPTSLIISYWPFFPSAGIMETSVSWMWREKKFLLLILLVK